VFFTFAALLSEAEFEVASAVGATLPDGVHPQASKIAQRQKTMGFDTMIAGFDMTAPELARAGWNGKVSREGRGPGSISPLQNGKNGGAMAGLCSGTNGNRRQFAVRAS
jgi:hypothetical protein